MKDGGSWYVTFPPRDYGRVGSWVFGPLFVDFWGYLSGGLRFGLFVGHRDFFPVPFFCLGLFPQVMYSLVEGSAGVPRI
jgi:hypothetical protein